MRIEECFDKATWDAFVRANAPRSGAFLQSWDWGDFQAAAGTPVRRLVILDESGIRLAAQLLRHSMPFGASYFFCPRGPVLSHLPTTSGTSMPDASLLGPLPDPVFVRLEPTCPLDAVPSDLRPAHPVSPAHTLVTDLSPDEAALLSGMHEKTRYNVRVAERKGVRVSLGTDGLDDVWPLFAETAARGRFRLHPKSYYQTMLAASPAFLAVARLGGDVVAANVMIDFNGTRTYLHGASSTAHRSAMGPYLLHWELMRDARRNGLSAYDWWGVAPDGADPSHPWSGITRFKLGFGGERVDYPGTFDLVAHPAAYRLYEWARRLRRAFRRP